MRSENAVPGRRAQHEIGCPESRYLTRHILTCRFGCCFVVCSASIALGLCYLSARGYVRWRSLHRDRPAMGLHDKRFSFRKIQTWSILNRSSDGGMSVIDSDGEVFAPVDGISKDSMGSLAWWETGSTLLINLKWKEGFSSCAPY
jgi:hypothetical protein